jgi:hypothetical protein
VTSEDLAQEAYAAYATHLDWHQPQGREMPVWTELGATYHGAWLAAVSRVLHLCGGTLEVPPEET